MSTLTEDERESLEYSAIEFLDETDDDDRVDDALAAHFGITRAGVRLLRELVKALCGNAKTTGAMLAGLSVMR